MKLIKIWRNFSDLPQAKQGPAIAQSLENEALDTGLELSEEVISRENGVDAIINRPDRIYKTDETENYLALENFKTSKGPENMKISDYLKSLNNYTTKQSPTELKCQKNE